MNLPRELFGPNVSSGFSGFFYQYFKGNILPIVVFDGVRTPCTPFGSTHAILMAFFVYMSSESVQMSSLISPLHVHVATHPRFYKHFKFDHLAM